MSFSDMKVLTPIMEMELHFNKLNLLACNEHVELRKDGGLGLSRALEHGCLGLSRALGIG